MKHFRKILATTDLSSESLSTVRYAVHLAKAQDASLVVLHVPPVPTTLYPDALVPVDITALADEIERAARGQLERWVKRYAQELPIKALVRRGLAVQDTICEVAAEVGASLLVMSTHGRKGIGHLVLGSVTERVLRDAPCPVLVVRPVQRPKSATSRTSGGRTKRTS
jgi:nucleotide-binding universal stress UspA family protein